MQESQYYSIHGYLEFFPIETGFVIPVFNRNGQLYVEVASDNIIDNFINIPDSYLKFLHIDHEHYYYEAKKGDQCCYAFKFLHETFYGNSNMLIRNFKPLLKNNIHNLTRASIEKFIERFDSPLSHKITVMIVDDHTLIRETWAFILSNAGHFEVVASVGDTQKAVELAPKLQPEIILMDINILPISGYEATTIIRKTTPKSRIIAVTMHSQPAYAKKMLQLGASGYVTKNSSKEEMIYAIEEVCKGHKYICQEIKNNIAELVMDEKETNINDLTEREIEIINLIRNGLSSKEMAAKLKISLKTIEVYRHNILKKLKLKNSASLVNYIASISA